MDSGPPNGSYTCDAAKMDPKRPARGMLPKSVVAGASMGDPTAAWLNASDGRMYGVFASSRQCSNCTWRNPGQYQALLFRTLSDTSWREWEFVSVFWVAPPTQTSPSMGFTNTPDAFRLPDGRCAKTGCTPRSAPRPPRPARCQSHSPHCLPRLP